MEGARTQRGASIMNSPSRRMSLMASPDKEPLEDCLSSIPRHLYLKREDLRVAIGTWNIQSAKHNEISSIGKWAQAKRGADVVVLGMQEVSSGRADSWVDKLSKELLTYDLVKVASKFKVNLVVSVYVAKRHFEHVHNVDKEKTRVNHAFSGKGALAIRFTLHSKRFLFVNCHLDHSIKSSNKRNANYQEVLNEVEIGPPKHCNENPIVNLTERPSFDDDNFSSPGSGKGHSLDDSEIGKHDYVFWFGNLNYRVTASAEEVLHLISQRRYDQILKYDQMTITMQDGSGFAGFNEAPITFAPTYKYFKDRDEYDCSKRSGVKRVPSYSDRVLWCCLPGKSRAQFLPQESNQLIPLKYKTYKEYRISDHRPLILMSAAAVYVPSEQNIGRINDLLLTGKGPAEIAEILAGELGLDPNDVGDLYRTIEPPNDTIIGQGTVYSSDEDEETLEQRQQRRMAAKMESLEKLVKLGPLSRTVKVTELRKEVKEFYHATEVFKATKPVLGGESYELLGEMCVNTMDRVDALEATLKAPVTCEKTLKWNEAVLQLAEQADLASDRLDAMMGKACRTRTPLASDDVLECNYDPYNLRAAYYSGYMSGTHMQHDPPAQRGSLPDTTPALEALQEKLQTIQDKEADLKQREGEAAKNAARLHTMEDLLRQKAGSIPTDDQANVSELDNLMQTLEEKELSILKHRAALSKEQLYVASKLAEQEALHASRVVTMTALEDELDRRTTQCDLMSAYLNRPAEEYITPPPRKANWVPGPGGGGGAVEINPNLTSYRRFSKKTKPDKPSQNGSPRRGIGTGEYSHFRKLNTASRALRHSSPPTSPRLDAPPSPTLHHRSRAYRSNSAQPRNRDPSNSFLSLLHGTL